MKTLANLRAEPVHLIVISGDANEARAKNLRAENFGRLEIGGNKDPGVEALPRGLRSYCVGQISRRGATDGLESKGFGLRQRHGHDAILEREGREIDGVILYIQKARANLGTKPGGGNQRSHADGNFGLVSGRDGKQLGVAPEIRGTPGDILGREARARGVEVVFDFERGETILADRTGAIAPIAVRVAAAHRGGYDHSCLRAVPGPCAPKNI